MARFGEILGEFLADESGISSIEYALLLALRAAALRSR